MAVEAFSDADTGCFSPACSQTQAEVGMPALCRHMDGVWRSADEAPRGADGRLLAHVALNGHGSYPTAGFIPRNLLAFNDYTSNQGAVWDPVSVSLTLVCPHTLMVSIHALLVLPTWQPGQSASICQSLSRDQWPKTILVASWVLHAPVPDSDSSADQWQ